MRTAIFLLVASILLPRCLRAQAAESTGNYYVLKESPGVRITSWFAYVNSSELLATSKHGRKYTLKAQHVLSLRWKQRNFLTVGGFEVRKGLTKVLVDYGFAEVLDTGRVVLLRYEYTTSIPLPLPVGGALTVASIPDSHAIYLLRDSAGMVAMPVWARRGQEQRVALRPYVASRPDLVAALGDRRFNENSLPAVIRALNSGQPFVPPAPPAVYLGID